MSEQQPEQPNPFVVPQTADSSPAEPSVADVILDLDAFMSSDIRRAEKVAYVVTRADLEARLDELDHELETLTDDHGRPLQPAGEQSIGEATGRTYETVKAERDHVRSKMIASKRGFRLLQMKGDDWQAFRTKWRKAFDTGTPYPDALWNEMVAACLVLNTPTTPEAVGKLRGILGAAPLAELEYKAWQVNANSGIDIPK